MSLYSTAGAPSFARIDTSKAPDLVLAELPAEEDDLVASLGREIQ
jgi:hypothetical protein